MPVTQYVEDLTGLSLFTHLVIDLRLNRNGWPGRDGRLLFEVLVLEGGRGGAGGRGGPAVRLLVQPHPVTGQLVFPEEKWNWYKNLIPLRKMIDREILIDR